VADEAKAESVPSKLPDIETKEGRWEVIRRAAEGEAAMVPLLRKVFDLNREKGGWLVEKCGNAHDLAVESLVRFISGKDLVVREALLRRLGALRDELAGPDPTPLERILSERVALTWLDANEMDRRFVASSGISFKEAARRESRRDRSHRRFLQACKTLATVRKLGGPTIQVNLANQQVNVAGSG
jgi:hypothetical protein